jgi:hypothetical protein
VIPRISLRAEQGLSSRIWHCWSCDAPASLATAAYQRHEDAFKELRAQCYVVGCIYDAAGLDASWRGDWVATAREYLAFRSYNLADASASTPLAAPPIAWTSMDQARPTRVQNGTRHQTLLGARRHSPTPYLPCSSFVGHIRTSLMPSSCPWGQSVHQHWHLFVSP